MYRAQKEMRMLEMIRVLRCSSEMGHYELFSRGGGTHTPPTIKTCKMHIVKILDCIHLFETGKYLRMCIYAFEL